MEEAREREVLEWEIKERRHRFWRARERRERERIFGKAGQMDKVEEIELDGFGRRVGGPSLKGMKRARLREWKMWSMP